MLSVILNSLKETLKDSDFYLFCVFSGFCFLLALLFACTPCAESFEYYDTFCICFSTFAGIFLFAFLPVLNIIDAIKENK